MMARPTPSTCVTAVGKEEDSDESQEEVDAPTERTNSAMWSMMAVMRRDYGVYTGVCSGYGRWFDLREMSAEIGEPRHVLQDASRHLQEAAWADYDAGSDRIRVRPTAPTTMPLSPSMPTRDRKAELESCKVEQLNMFFRFLPIIRKISKLYDTCYLWTLGIAEAFPEKEVDEALWSARAAGIPESLPIYLALRGKQAEWWMHIGRGPSEFETSKDHPNKRRRVNSALPSTASTASTSSTGMALDNWSPEDVEMLTHIKLAFDAVANYDW